MRHTTEKYTKTCGCRSVGECNHNFLVSLTAINACIDDFAEHLRKKLHRKFMEGKDGWDDPQWPKEEIIKQLREHIDKGDMIDVAAFAMFAWNRD